MCIAIWLLGSHPQYRFLLALNRDEVHHRPTEPVHWWKDGKILGGRDCKAGGTWLACSKYGRLAFLTNFREPTSIPEARSRGELIIRFLQSLKTPMEFAEEIAKEGNKYNGFNLIVADLCTTKMAYVSNRPEGAPVLVQEVSPGMHVLCNAHLDTPWPKVQRLRQKFEDLLQKFGKEEISEMQIIENALEDTVRADRATLPQTGCDPEWEYQLSSIFVDCDSDEGPYGTRSMIVLAVKPSGQLTFYERYLEEKKWREHRISYQIQPDVWNSENRFARTAKRDLI